jgi:hypothetical protein
MREHGAKDPPDPPEAIVAWVGELASACGLTFAEFCSLLRSQSEAERVAQLPRRA